MNSLIRIQYLLAVLFLVFGASFYLIYKSHYSDPQLLNSSGEFTQKVSSINDIEHLRKVLLTVVNTTDTAVLSASKAIDAAVFVGVMICIVAAAVLIGCASKAREIAKSAQHINDNAL